MVQPRRRKTCDISPLEVLPAAEEQEITSQYDISRQRHGSGESFGSNGGRTRPSVASMQCPADSPFQWRKRSSPPAPRRHSKSEDHKASVKSFGSQPTLFKNSIKDHKISVSTRSAFTNFSPIAAQYPIKEKERIARLARYRTQEDEHQEQYKDLRDWHKGAAQGRAFWPFSRLIPQPNTSLSKNDLVSLACYHFPPRSALQVLVTDYKPGSVDCFEINLGDIQQFMSNKPSNVDVRWLHAPLGLGPVHSTIEDMFLHAGQPAGRKFLNLGRSGWPYAEIEVLNFQSRTRFQEKRDVYHMLKEYGGISDTLTNKCWEGFDKDLRRDEKGILDDLKWRFGHLGITPDFDSLSDFWTVVCSDISWQLSEGLSMASYGPLDGLQPSFLRADDQALHHHDFFNGSQLVRDPFRFFHRGDGFLLTLSPMRGVNYLDRHLQRHMDEPPGAIFKNDVASAVAFVRREFEDKGTLDWQKPTVEWLTVHLITELGITPHVDRQGMNAPTLEGAYQRIIQTLKHRRHEHFQRRCGNEPAELISVYLLCKEELRRIVLVLGKRKKVFANLLKDVHAFNVEDADDGIPPLHPDNPSEIEMVSGALQRTVDQQEAFERLLADVGGSLEAVCNPNILLEAPKMFLTWLPDLTPLKVYELRSIQQRQAAMISETQNRALFLFTIVGILFIPFGAVTGYWGMNLEDIRNSGWTQKHFWRLCGGVALPVSLWFVAWALWRWRREKVRAGNEVGRKRELKPVPEPNKEAEETA